MLSFFDEPLGMPLHGGKQRKGWILKSFDHAIGRGGDDLQAATDLAHSLLVVGVDGNIALADRAAELRFWIELDGMPAGLAIRQPAMLERALALAIGQELIERAAAIDVHQLRAETDAQRRHPAPL